MILQDLRYAIRMFSKSPGFTIVAVLTLAIGIGANTAIFSVLNAVLLRPLPFRDPDALCLLTERLRDIPIIGPSYQNFQDWREQSHSFEQIAGVRNVAMNRTGVGEPERIIGQMVTANLFTTLGVAPVQGRVFSPLEDRAGAPGLALLTYPYWQTHFAGRPVLGQSITLDNEPYTIIGVMPPGFQLFQAADVVMPFEPWAARLPDDRSWHPGISAIGRLRPGVSLANARSELELIAKRLERQYPKYNTGTGANVSGLHDVLVQNVRPALLVLLGAVALVLLIACTNVANLLLARGNMRRREMALRIAIGAGRGRLLHQLLAESLVLALAGALAGVAGALLALRPLQNLAGKSLPDLGPIALDYRVLLFTTALALLAAILFGLAPFFQNRGLDLRSALNEGARGAAGSRTGARVRGFLVAGEIALAMVLLVGAGLLLRSFERLQDVAPGFNPSHLLVADVPVSPQAYSKPADRMAFFDRALERVQRLPGVTSVGAAASLPVSAGGSLIHFNIEGRPPKTAGDYIVVGYRPVSSAYLQTLGVPLLQGRFLQPSDTDNSPFVTIVNRSMAKRFFPGESALGKHIQIGALPHHEFPYMGIVGIVDDVKQSLASDPVAEIYIPFRQANRMLPVYALSFVLRTGVDPRSESTALLSAMREVDPNQPVVKIRTMDENIAGSVSEPRFRSVLLGIFALSALVLAGIGLYGLMAFSVSQRTQEFGVRIALGSSPAQVQGLVVRDGLRITLIGVVAGIAGALALSRVVASFLYGTTATDVPTYAEVAGVLVAVAVIACVIPARKALGVDPIVALRHE